MAPTTTHVHTYRYCLCLNGTHDCTDSKCSGNKIDAFQPASALFSQLHACFTTTATCRHAATCVIGMLVTATGPHGLLHDRQRNTLRERLLWFVAPSSNAIHLRLYQRDPTATRARLA